MAAVLGAGAQHGLPWHTALLGQLVVLLQHCYTLLLRGWAPGRPLPRVSPCPGSCSMLRRAPSGVQEVCWLPHCVLVGAGWPAGLQAGSWPGVQATGGRGWSRAGPAAPCGTIGHLPTTLRCALAGAGTFRAQCGSGFRAQSGSVTGRTSWRCVAPRSAPH